MTKIFRKKFRKVPQAFSEKELKVLFVVGLKKPDEILTQTEIARRLKMPITTVNYQFTKFQQRGLLNEHKELTDKGKKVLRFFKEWDTTFTRKLRAHNIGVILYLDRLPTDFQEKHALLRPFTNKRYRGLMAELPGCTVLFYSNRKAVVYLPDIYGNSDEEIAAVLAATSTQLIQGLEIEFPGLKVAKYKPAKFHSIDVAILDSAIAESFILKNKRIYSTGRIMVDKSHGRYELEAVDATTALEDIEIIVRYEDLARENRRLNKLMEELRCELETYKKEYENSHRIQNPKDS